MTCNGRSADEIFTDDVTRILAWYDKASPDQQERGRCWYRVAHDLAAAITGADPHGSEDLYHHLVRMGAGVISALSPQNEWGKNTREAERAVTNGYAAGHTKANVAKADRILRGEDPEQVLPLDAKTGHFFRNIADPEDADSVTIDAHAWGAMVEPHQRKLGITPKRYAHAAHCYREAARLRGVIPSVMQATVWVVYRDTPRKDR